jgi:hypothetical protein
MPKEPGWNYLPTSEKNHDERESLAGLVVARTILDSFREMIGPNFLAIRQISNRACHAQHAMIAARIQV